MGFDEEYYSCFDNKFVCFAVGGFLAVAKWMIYHQADVRKEGKDGLKTSNGGKEDLLQPHLKYLTGVTHKIPQ